MRPVIFIALLTAAAGTALAQPQPALPAGMEAAQEPELPSGLDDGDEPSLPEGLGEDSGEPSLPEGLDQATPDTAITAAPRDDGPLLGIERRGFLDLRAGSRILSDSAQKRASLGEARLQLDLRRTWVTWSTTAQVVGDLVFDPVLDEYEVDLESGDGIVDLREANLTTSPTTWADLKLGRQILTWGTGDLLFINDLFPKDWNALLVGRDLNYLKAPSDAVKLSLFHRLINVDVVFTPRFDSDRYPDRRRISSWDPNTQAVIGGVDTVPPVDQPDRWFRDNEWAARLSRRFGAYEVAAYGYRGYWKAPAGADASTGLATFPKLSVYGASVRAPVLGGIGNLEGGLYDSRLDRDGDDPFVRNSELRGLIGYERELVPELTMGVQYYVEHALDAETRQVATTRLTWMAMNQNLTTSVFLFASPDDRDLYLRASATYRIDDHWRAQLAGNLFAGADQHTMFGQFQDATNLYASARYAW